MDYSTMVQAILTLHHDSVGRAAGAINQALLFRNWLIGAYVVEYEQRGEDRAAYGARLLANLARDLRHREVAGCSAEMLGRMRLFYRALPQLEARIPPSAFGKFLRLTRSSAAGEISSSPMTKSGSEDPIPLVVRNNSVTRRRASPNIRDVVHPRLMWLERRTIFRGDVAKTAPGFS
jgi:hypothetical protein